MKPKLARRRYMFTVMGASLGYVGSVAGCSYLHRKVIDGSTPGILLSLLPGAFLCLMLLAVWRYLNDVDEVARHDMTQAMIIGLFVLLALSGGWGLVELFNDSLPRLPIFYAFPAFFITFGLVSGFKYKRCV